MDLKHSKEKLTAIADGILAILAHVDCTGVKWFQDLDDPSIFIFIAFFNVAGKTLNSPAIRVNDADDFTALDIAPRLTPPKKSQVVVTPGPVTPERSHPMFTRYGMMFDEDCDVIDACLAQLIKKPVVKVLEIGAYEFHTGRGMKRYLEAHGSSIEYWGIEPGKLVPLKEAFPGAHIINEKSEWAFHLVPDDFDVVFVDGDHSRNAVILDIANYAPKVLPGGFMIFHDTNPKAQLTGYEYDGPPKIPEFGVAVRAAWDLIGWPWYPWSFFMEKWAVDHHQNGATAFRKMPH